MLYRPLLLCLFLHLLHSLLLLLLLQMRQPSEKLLLGIGNVLLMGLLLRVHKSPMAASCSVPADSCCRCFCSSACCGLAAAAAAGAVAPLC